MDKAGIADTMEKIATLLELKGENPFKIRAYTNAARSIETWGGNVSDLRDQETLEKIPGIGKAIAAKIKELVETGSLKFFEELRAEFPEGILELFTLPGLGGKKIKALYEQLHVGSIAQLREACESDRVAELPGFGKTTQEKIARAIADRAKHAGSFQLGQIAVEAETLQNDLRALDEALHVCIAGSYRRRKEIVRDLDFIVATKAPEVVSEFFVEHPLVESVIAQGATKSSVRLHSGIQCDLRVVTSTEYPFALNYFTGSKEHNIVVRNRALQRGWTLNEYRLAPAPVDPAAKRKTESAADSGDSRGGRSLPRARPGLHRAGVAGKLRRIRSGRGRALAALDREGKSARHLSLPYHRQRRPQLARGDGGRGARNWVCNISGSPITAAARFRRMVWTKRGCARRWRTSARLNAERERFPHLRRESSATS